MRIFSWLILLLWILSGIGCTGYSGDSIPEVEIIEDTLPFFDEKSWTIRYPDEKDEFPAMRALLSRYRYWSQDKHIDVVVQLDSSKVDSLQGTILEGSFLNINGEELADFTISPPGERFIFYPVIPDEFIEGGKGTLVLTWKINSGEELAYFSREFSVEYFDEPVSSPGSIPIKVPNNLGVVERSFPVTVGIPFPRGALYDVSQLRLVSVDGNSRDEIPFQVKEVSRWSKFGPVKWIHLDFTVDLPGSSRELELEYGAGIKRDQQGDIRVEKSEGFPVINAGRLRFDDGLWFDPSGGGNHVKVLEERGLYGAFVEHEDKRLYRMAASGDYEIEESGSEKIVLRREGWYIDSETGNKFCKYITRYIIHRNSPLVRIFHSWIFTGDGNSDRIADMGWEFSLAEGFEPQGFLTDFEGNGDWIHGDYLLQYDYEHFDIVDRGLSNEFPGGRAAGVASAAGKGLSLYFGTKDFWQNYPSELEFCDGSLWFHNWPKHNRPPGYTFEGELILTSGDPALPSAARHDNYVPGRLSQSEWKLNFIQARFAHEGELLDFRFPEKIAGNKRIWKDATRNGGNLFWELGNPESANAQGISRTEEMWLYMVAEDSDKGGAKKVLEGLNDESLRAVVDPSWIAKSGVFYNMHPQDWDNYPEEEHLYEQMALAVPRWQERLGTYGMWIYGDHTTWAKVDLDNLEPALYRGFRKRHHGWPYSWIPYARSGDPRLLKAAEAATRQNIDANYCHFVSEDVGESVGDRFRRRKGVVQRSPLPWVTRHYPTTRCYESKVDYLLHPWYLTGYHRAKDILCDWAGLTKIEEPLWARGPIRIDPSRSDYRFNLLIKESYLKTYKATFDPWFLVAAHSIAEGHLQLFEAEKAFSTHGTSVQPSKAASHFWRPADREILRYTGDMKYKEFYLAYADFWGGHWETPSWQIYGAPMVESNEYAWQLMGDDYYLRRVSYFIDWLKAAVWDGEKPDYVRGYYAFGASHAPPQFIGWALEYFPFALSALDKAGYKPDPIPELFEVENQYHNIFFKKQADKPVSLRLRWALREFRIDLPERIAEYSIIGPEENNVMGGKWEIQKNKLLEIPEDFPAGIYHLKVINAGKLVVPVVKQLDVPEILLFDKDGEVKLGRYNNNVWFYVPKEIDHFEILIPLGTGHHIKRISVWDPDGERVWDLNYHRESYHGADPVRAMIRVSPQKAGRLWRITMPDDGAGFRMDTKIPPVYSVSPDKWFMPENINKN